MSVCICVSNFPRKSLPEDLRVPDRTNWYAENMTSKCLGCFSQWIEHIIVNSKQVDQDYEKSYR